jgi:hypothetical protein
VSRFNERLTLGHVVESKIAKWLIARGCHVLPAYQIIEQKANGPQLFSKAGNFVTPDMFVFSKSGALWIEAKHKTAFTYHRITGRFVTGIDLNHWRDYLEVKRLTSVECWLMFNHLGGTAKDSPPSPSGLFTGEIGELSKCVNHTHANWGKHGMIYWAIHSLKRIGEPL